MCILTYIPGGKQPDTIALANGAEFNDDGHGYAIIVGSRIIVGHGMDSAKVIAEFAARRKRYPDGPALFHSRWSTHGSVTKANCHPFRVGGDKRTVLAHNGVLPRLVQPGKGDRRSDTRIAAEEFIPMEPFGSLATEKGRKGLEAWLGSGNKFVILTVDPAYGQQAIILNESAGIWDDGIWYSNDGYLDDPRPFGNWQAPSWWDDEASDAYGPCAVCEGGKINPVTGYCRECGACVDCESEEGVCDCYYPASPKPRAGDDKYDGYYTEYYPASPKARTGCYCAEAVCTCVTTAALCDCGEARCVCVTPATDWPLTVA